MADTDSRMHMKTPVMIVCGKDLTTQFMMHEELLRHHSRVLEERFSRAKPLRKLYKQSHALRDKIAAHVFPEATADDSEATGHQEQVCCV